MLDFRGVYKKKGYNSPELNMFSLKNYAWKMIHFFWDGNLSGASCLNFGAARVKKVENSNFSG